MKFGLFYEHQLPRPWGEGDEAKLFSDALDQVALADGLGYDMVWEVEHHFLEEYSHSSAPEIFLAACSQRTKQIRLGHGIVLMPPQYNHPARVAERIATLDLVSGGRVEWGTGESASRMEIDGYAVDAAVKRESWREAVEQCANMMAMNPYPGFDGKHFSMPCRNVVPKPVQRPHPPLWMACSSREAIRTAAQAGIGALTFAFVAPEEAKQWVDEYYDVFKRECVPIGHAVNPNICMISGFSVHNDREVAIQRGLEGFQFFGYALAHFYVFGEHQPGRTNVWENFQKSRDSLPQEAGGIGTPDEVRKHLMGFAEAGVDQVAFVQQGGRNKHEHICEALDMFAAEIMPAFKEREAEREARKAELLAPHIEAALERKAWMPALADKDIPISPPMPRRPMESQEAADRALKNAQGWAAAVNMPMENPAKMAAKARA